MTKKQHKNIILLPFSSANTTSYISTFSKLNMLIPMKITLVIVSMNIFVCVLDCKLAQFITQTYAKKCAGFIQPATVNKLNVYCSFKVITSFI